MTKSFSGRANPSIWFTCIQAFFAVWAIVRLCGMSARNIVAPILFAALIYFFQCASAQKAETPAIYDFRISIITLLLSGFFTLLTLLAEHQNLTAGLQNRLFQAFALLACCFGLFFLFYHFLLLLFSVLAGYVLAREYAPIGFLPLFGFFACLLCWLPYFLYEYPGIMTPDSINQLEQALGMIPYSNHHPWMHTLLLQLIYSFGQLFTNDVTTVLAFFTVFQMCFLAFCIAWLLSTLQRLQVGNLPCLFALAFYALVPYHGVFAVTIWKDVLFSGSVLLFTTSLLRLLLIFPKNRHSMNRERNRTASFALSVALYILSGLMFCLFRTNGWYAFLFSLPFLFYAFRHCFKAMLPVHLAILAVALLVRGPVMSACQVTQPDFVESVSIPLQQVARVICDDKGLTPDEWDSVHNVIDTSYIRSLYSPGFADNMKELVRAGHPEYLTAHKEEYFRLWLTLGLRYPATYIQAYIDQTIGYWYPDVEYAVGNIDGIPASQTGAVSRPVIGGPFIVKGKEILLKLSDILPLYGLLTSMGAMFWLFLCCIAVAFIKEQTERYILFLPGLAILLTLLAATPVSTEFRYAYSLAYTLPLYLLTPFFRLD